MGSPFQKSLLCRRKKAARKRLLLAIAVLLHVEADRRGENAHSQYAPLWEMLNCSCGASGKYGFPCAPDASAGSASPGAYSCAACRSSRCDAPGLRS